MVQQENDLSTLWYALLGLIKMQPNTGYGLRKIFEETPMARYSSSPGAIYPALRNLEARTLISGRIATGKTGREKQTYRCTAAGTRSLLAWLRQPVSVDQIKQELDVVLLRFSYLDLVDDLEWSTEFLQQFIAATKQHRQQLHATQQTLEPHQPLHGQLALVNGIQLIDAHLQWAATALQTLKQVQQQ